VACCRVIHGRGSQHARVLRSRCRARGDARLRRRGRRDRLWRARRGRAPERRRAPRPQAYSDGTWAGCSGTLIAPTVFLTAEHCDFGVDRIAVTFASTYVAGKSKAYWGTWHGDPLYSGAQDDPHDIAVVVLDKAVAGITPVRLPTAGSLPSLPDDQSFTSVGYGAQSVTVHHGPTLHYADTRFVATSDTLFATNKAWLRISMNPGLGDGGTCYGDSGGPNFLGAGTIETDIVAAITVTGDFM
jgi:hypothetical protein